MKTLAQLLMGILGLSALITLPALAQNNRLEDTFNGTPLYTAQGVPSTPSEDGQTPTSSPEAAPATKNLVEQAASSNQFQTLAKVVKAAGLEEALAAEGPYTVFAPTDEAFAALPKGAVEQLLLPENKQILVQLLSYHVVQGAVTSSQIKSGDIKTLAGEPVAVKVGEDGTVTVNNAKVTQADIQASNGVIHAVDQVILPQEVQTQSKAAPKQ